MNHEEPRLHARIFGPLLFFSIASIAIYFFVTDTLSLVNDIADQPTTIYFNKGSMYLLGGATSSFFLFLGVFYFSLFKKNIDKKREHLLAKGMIAGIAIMFLLPQAAHFSIYHYVSKKKYFECKEAEHSWLFYKTYVYVKNQPACLKLINRTTKKLGAR